MDIKFDAYAAEELLKQMDIYCRGVMNETRALLNTVRKTDGWNDLQKDSFRNNVEELARDLNSALSLESDYMRTFHERVTELRG